MTTSVGSENIPLNFRSRRLRILRHGGWSRGGSDIGVIDLEFKNANAHISVHIPENIFPTTVQKLSFTCTNIKRQNVKSVAVVLISLLLKKHAFELLNVTIKQIQNLKIKVGVFEEESSNKYISYHCSGTNTHERKVLRPDSELKLEMPKELEIGKKNVSPCDHIGGGPFP